MEINVLMIDDHQLIIEGYKSILSYNDNGYTISTVSANSAEKAFEIITNSKQTKPFDVVFLDLTIPPFVEKNIFSGEDLVDYIRNYFPKVKIIILTSHTEKLVLHDVIKKSKPDGLLIKSDLVSEVLLIAFDIILKGGTYFSTSASLQDFEINHKILDSYNRQIILLLSQGVKSKSIEEQLHLSKSAIDKRKVIIKQFLKIDKGNDEDLLREARKLGLI